MPVIVTAEYSQWQNKYNIFEEEEMSYRNAGPRSCES